MNASDRQHELSPDGLARRDAMLGDLQSVMRRTHRMRRARRLLTSAGVVGAAVLLISIAVPRVSPPPGLAPQIAELDRPRPEAWRVERGPSITVVVEQGPPQRTSLLTTDPAVLERCRADAPLKYVLRIDDVKLLQTLASINRPAGLIYYGERVMLTAPVADADFD